MGFARQQSLALGFVAAVCMALFQATSAPGQVCLGDCDEDGFVTVDELIRGVNIALGTLSTDACRAFDANGDELVTVDEIVAAVVNALDGCPQGAPTSTPTATSSAPQPSSTPTQFEPITSTPTPTPTASPAVAGPVQVLISTGDFIGTPQRKLTSLVDPVLSPDGSVLVVGSVEEESDQRGVLLRLDDTGGRIILEQGDPIPGSDKVVLGINQPNGKASGSYIVAETEIGASLLRIRDDGTVDPLLGTGAAGNRADFEPRLYVVSPTGDTVLADAFTPSFERGLIAVSAAGDDPAIPIIVIGDKLDYTNDAGDPVSGTVTFIDLGEAVSTTPDGGTGRVVVDDSLAIFIAFPIDSQMDPRAVLVEGNEVPGSGQGVRPFHFDTGLFTGGDGAFDTRGFLTSITGGIGLGVSGAMIITDASYEALLLVQTGSSVPDTPDTVIGGFGTLVMGRRGAAVSFRQEGPDEFGGYGIGYADYATNTFKVVVPAESGVFNEFSLIVGISDADQIIFLGEPDVGNAAYYAASITESGAPPRRLVSTGDDVALPGGGSATVTNFGLAQQGSGLGGEATALGPDHFTVSATLDQSEQAILLVEIGE